MALSPPTSLAADSMSPPFAMMVPRAYVFWNSNAHQAMPRPSADRDEMVKSLLSTNRSSASLLLLETACQIEVNNGVSANSESST
eukprot:CAMPEP_0117487294 /NCGR_PEP_ID=MMETSP0784-20121206/15921_1 /TAXON_ID=39447 /ORGANISM="" /LENGTH=84 /DNA_ID=CAMNT_0005281937 /DNA_START=47 /DNA_END=298 /DNA_ORIENTATION=+